MLLGARSPPCTPAPRTSSTVMPRMPLAFSCSITLFSRHGRMMACTAAAAGAAHVHTVHGNVRIVYESANNVRVHGNMQVMPGDVCATHSYRL